VKLICSTIFIFCCSHFLLAQNVTNTIEYTWQSNDGKTAAQISIKPESENDGNRTIFYFIAMQDSVSNNLVDINFNNIVTTLPSSCTTIKISLSQKLDTLEVRDFFKLSKLVVTEILLFVHQKHAVPNNLNAILAGVDAGAEIALTSALSFPDKFNKTALFFNKAFAGFAYSNQFDVLAPSIKGKLFLYVKHTENEINIIDDMVIRLALKSSIMLYKIDVYEEENIYFEDGYKWLMADGNNYIIKTE
jgi:hypothetical protein